MNFLINFIKGIFVGIANVIPGVSGGTMAVSFGIYDKLLSSIANLLKDFKNSIKNLLPIVAGMAVGVIGFTFIIPYLLENQPFATSMAFTGLILGGIPMIVASILDSGNTTHKPNILLCIVLFFVFVMIAVGMLFMNGSEDSGVLLSATPSTIIIVFFMGVIASATMIIPGVSGSLVLMILGYYFGILSAVKDFISALKDFDMSGLINNGLILAPFAIGCILGIFFISKLIEWLFAHFKTETFSSILGLIVASPISIFYKVNQEYGLKGTNAIQIIVGILLFVICCFVTLYMGRAENKLEK